MADEHQATGTPSHPETHPIEQHDQTGEEREEQPKLYTSISFLKKRPDISHAQFYHHWSTTHASLALPWMKRHGFRSYTQYHSLPALNASGVFAPIGPEKRGGDTDILRGYDGAAVIEVDSLEAFQKAFEDEYYEEVIAVDERAFLDKEAGVLRTRAEAKKILKFL
ncbi:ethD domain-containing protein [Sarocladium implicatum]|jgi:hypothetical protein|nr:ethD domain-containing protein [Sarocladium implicatum]